MTNYTMTDWLPIDTAPLDGARIIVWGEYGSLYAAFGPRSYDAVMVRAIAMWDEGEWIMTTPDETPTVDVREMEWDGPQEASIKPTHWMPLPPPPVERVEDEE